MSQFISSNPYFILLSEANNLHIQAGVKHQQLLDLCKSNGVKFEDLDNYLMNQAKKAGLYKKSLYDPKKAKQVYPPKSQLSVFSWFNSIKRFNSWVRNNYTDYGVYAPKKKVKTGKEVVTQIRRPVIEVNLSAPPKGSQAEANAANSQMAEPSQSAEEIIEQDSKEHVTPDSTPKGDGSTGNQKPDIINTRDLPSPVLNRPIEASLSLADKQALLIRNRSVMKDMAIEKDAQEEWNLFCEAMEWSDMMIPDTKLQVV